MLSIVSGVLRFVAAVAVLLGKALWRFLKAAARFWRGCFYRAPKPTAIVSAVVLVAALGGVWYGADGLQHQGRMYENVCIGGIDVSGMTQDEAVQAVAADYEQRLHASGITAYASQEAMDAHAENATTDDTVSTGQEKAETQNWQTDANALQASIDYQGLIDQAMQRGRGGLVDRISARFDRFDVDVVPDIDTQAVETFASSIDESIGTPYENWGISIDDGQASVTEGYDGNMVDRAWLTGELQQLLISDPSVAREFVAWVQYTPVQIDQAAAQAACDKVNLALSDEMDFTCSEASWTFEPDVLGNLITTEVEQRDDGSYRLAPHIDIDKAKRRIVQKTDRLASAQDSYTVAFEKADDGVYVDLSEPAQVPNAQAAAEELESMLFGDQSSDTQGDIVRTIDVQMEEVPQRLSFDDALSMGVITDISSYTTEYTARAEARNWNIHLASDTINGSIVTANGGTWSFNETTGERTEEAGYQQAGVVVGNTTSEDYGGGICQVATTIFNAVYEGGYPVLQRRNHSIYMAGYPAGRDAAVSWTSPDLVWQNDTSSDVLLVMRYTGTTVTATLYGIDPGYSVSTVTGDWQQGATYKTTYVDDSSLASGQQQVKKSGQNGRSITVTRTVKDANGNVVRTDVFESNYLAQDEVIARGTA